MVWWLFWWLFAPLRFMALHAMRHRHGWGWRRHGPFGGYGRYGGRGYGGYGGYGGRWRGW